MRAATAGFAKLGAGVARSGEDVEVDTGAEVTRWRRYGKDRLYVTAVDGTKMGWRDLLTGEDHLDARGLEREFRAALATWVSDAGQESPAVVIPPAPPVVDDREPEAHE